MGNEHWDYKPIFKALKYVKTGVPCFEGKKRYFSTGSIQENNFIQEGSFDFEERPSRANRIAMIGDVFQARMKETNKPVFVNADLDGCLFSTGFMQFRPIDASVLDKFIFYYLQSPAFLNDKNNGSTGCTQISINDNNLSRVVFPIPSMDEQLHIVEKLDALLPRIKHVKFRLESITPLLNKFRQSVLSAACSGKLTENWRNDHSVDSDWETKALSEISASISTGPFGTMLHKSDYIKGSIPVINPTNIIDNKILPDPNVTVTYEKAQELSRYILKENDIILSRRGDLSKCGIVTKSEDGWLAGTGTFIVRVSIHPCFFRMVFQNPSTQELIYSASIGSTMPNLNQSILGSLKVPCPIQVEQQEIVNQVNRLFSLADSLESKYNIAMARIEKIEQSILAKAFRGELLSNEQPEHQEESDGIK